MIAKSAHTTLRVFPTMIPVRISRQPKRYPRTRLFSNQTKSEIIEIAERSGKPAQDLTPLVSALALAATVTMSMAALAVFGMQIAELIDTQLQLSTGDLMRVIAGR